MTIPPTHAAGITAELLFLAFRILLHYLAALRTVMCAYDGGLFQHLMTAAVRLDRAFRYAYFLGNKLIAEAAGTKIIYFPFLDIVHKKTPPAI